MNILPANRRLKLKECQIVEQEDHASFLIPDQAKKKEENGTFEILSVSDDCEKSWTVGSKVVVPLHMVETIKVQKEETKMVLENYVMCIIVD